jgi:hypothetical protein
MIFVASVLVVLGVGVAVPLVTSHSVSAQGTSAFVSYDCDSQGSSGLQTAESSVAAGGTLLIAGTCDETSTPLMVTANTTVEGNNSGTIIDGSIEYPSTSPDDPITIRDLEVNCATTSDANDACIDIQNGFRVSITGVVTMNGDYGIELSAPTCSKGSGCNVNDFLSDNFISDPTIYGFYVNDPADTITDGMFVHSWIDGGPAGSDTDDVYLTNAAGWFVTDDHLYGPGVSTAIYAYRLFGSSISDNDIEYGGVSAILQKDSEPVVISNNRIKNGTITETTIGSTCYVTMVGNVTDVPISTTSTCTNATAANLSITS